MNKITRGEVFGLPIVGIVFAAMAVFVYQFMWFASVFKTRWNILIELPEEQLIVPLSWWVLGFGFIVAQMVGIAHALRRAGWPSFGKTISETVVMALLFAAPVTALPLLYHPDHSWERFGYEAGAFITSWILGAVIIRAMKADGADDDTSPLAEAESVKMLSKVG